MADEMGKSVLIDEQDTNMTKDIDIPKLTENHKSEVYKYFQNGQLNFVGQGVKKIPEHLIEDHCAVTLRLDLSFNALSVLDGLERFINLEELVLDSNMIDDTAKFPSLKRLQTLTLNKNQLSNLDSLLEQIHDRLPSLTYLSLLGNTACPNQLSSEDKDDDDYQRYRYYVLYCLPKLKFLDSSAVKPAEHSEAKRVGSFMKVVRAKDIQTNVKDCGIDLAKIYSPLPDKTQNIEHIGTFGKSNYVYYGRNSEGNRFIRNKDL